MFSSTRSLKKNINAIKKVLSTEINIDFGKIINLINNILIVLFKQDRKIKTYYFKEQIKPAINIKELSETSINLKTKNININTSLNVDKTTFNFNMPEVKQENTLYQQVKLNNKNIELINTCREYPVNFKKNCFPSDNIIIDFLALFNCKTLSNKELHLQKNVRLTEEIIELAPYVKKATISNILEFPVVKKPLFKNNFSSEELRSFRSTLAKEHKTSRGNIELISIIDNFSPNLYTSIQPNLKTGEVTCYLNKKAKDYNTKLQYLLIAKKRDTGKVINATATLNKITT